MRKCASKTRDESHAVDFHLKNSTQSRQIKSLQIKSKPQNQTKMSQSLELIFAALIVAQLAAIGTKSSGVFELEITNFESQSDASNSSYNRQPKYVSTFICLKEAFTSQFDGPCTFGNATVALNTQNLNHNNQNETSSADSSKSKSTSDNSVRILFTFRWTKSFTIIFKSSHQISTDDKADNQNLDSRRTFLAQNGISQSAVPISAGPSRQIAATNESGTRNHPAGIQQQSLLDRHVLTENQVLPNLESNANKPWTSRFSRTLKSSLAYKFRVYCSLNYYGDGCTTFCRPRDDQFGHYNCSSSGQKICLDGWHGVDCDKAKCRPGCNQQHGYCEKPDTCLCRPGWSGPRCDECMTYPGCQNGYCLSPWQCLCHNNWGGVLCDLDLNYCGTHEPCKNNATCQNIAPARYKCICPEGFAGVNCDISLDSLPGSRIMTSLNAGCALNPCLNGGTCFGFSPSLEPHISGLIESTIAVDGDAEFPQYRCQCTPDWTGDYCQWPASSIIQIINSTSDDSNHLRNNSNLGEAQNGEDNISLDQSITNDTSQTEKTTLIVVNDNHHPSNSHLNMRHLISAIIVASLVGVLVASLLLAWCCLLAVEKGYFSFIQMNIIRNENGFTQPAMSTLRRMHEKIRDSLRSSSSGHIKPETKFNIENVLRAPKPPPSYEESKHFSLNLDVPSNQLTTEKEPRIFVPPDTLVAPERHNRVHHQSAEGQLHQLRLAEHQQEQQVIRGPSSISNAQLNCPKHGHLYRQQYLNKLTSPDSDDCTTKLEIKYP